MPNRHPSNSRALASRLPLLWLVSDQRNDHHLENALMRLPRGSGFIFRHYHLPAAARRQRFAHLARIARLRGHTVLLAGTMREARSWGADGAYGAPASLHAGAGGLRLVTVHSLRELRQSVTARANGVLVSPVFATRSHPQGRTLGFVRWQGIAAHARAPVIALGGMTHHAASTHSITRWAAIDGLSGESRHSPTSRFPVCS